MQYQEIAETFEKLEGTQKTLEKTEELAQLYGNSEEQLPEVVLLTTGTPIPRWEDIDLGVSSKTVIKIISEATGHKEKEIEEIWKEKGDLGFAAEKTVKNKKQTRLIQKDLTVQRVVEKFRKVAEMEKQGISQSVNQDKKIKELSDLISSAEPIEARYLARTMVNHLRIGVGTGIIRDALAQAYYKGENTELIQQAYDLTNDFSQVAEAVQKGPKELQKLDMQLFQPINSMLAKKVETIEEGFEEVGKPAAIDYKYDGMRAQIHKKQDEVKIFTRRLENVTKQFPDIKETIKNKIKAENVIIDTEIVGYDPETKETIEFQKLSRRIKRKYEIEKLKQEIPVKIRPFDLLYKDNSLVNQKYEERWSELQQIVQEEENEITMVDHKVTSKKEEVNKMHTKALDEGHEGIMMKNLNSEYKPGSRVGYMVKLKPVMETLDLAIIGGEWSEGRRTGWIGSLKLGCWNQETQKYEGVGRMATGLTDEQLEEITQRLKPLIISEDGKDVKVKPEVIVEVEFEEIQKSPKYQSGYAMRFPRLKQFRDDKEDADNKEKVERLYEEQ